MSPKSWAFTICLCVFTIIGLFELTALSFDSLTLRGKTKTQDTIVAPDRARKVTYNSDVDYGPRFVDEQGLPAIGPTSKLVTHDIIRIIEEDAVVEGVRTEGTIFVEANNVTIRDFEALNVVQNPQYHGMLLEDGLIDGRGEDVDGIKWSNYAARRVEIRNVVDGMKSHGNVLLEDVWVHDLTTSIIGKATPHNDCLQISSGSNITINHSRFEKCGTNAAIFIKSDEGEIDDVTLTNNILGSGNYTFQALKSPAQPGIIPQRISLTRNLFLGDAVYGPLHINIPVKFDGNVDRSGSTVSR